MKISIESARGVVTDRDGSGVTIEGREYHEAPFHGRWDDLYAFIDEGVGPAGLTYEAFRDTGFFMRFFRHNQNDNIFMTYQMPHQWDTTTAVYPHMHFVPMASGSGTLKFNYSYAWMNEGEIVPSSSGWTSGSVSASLDPSDQYTSKHISFGAITPTSQLESSILIFKVERPGSSDASDTYQTSKDHQTASANVAVLFFDLHYQKSKAGSIEQFPKVP